MSDTKFVFSDSFEKRIDLLCKSYDKLYSILNGLQNKQFANYGLCAVDYGFRIIRPSDVATYVDFLLKMMTNRQLDFGSPTDLNVFNVSFVKKVLKENGSDSLEKAREDACGLSWINPKRTTLDDIRVMLEHECFGTAIYSNWEMAKRVRTDQFESDMKLISDMKFVGAMRSVVNAIPGILNESDYFKNIGNSNLIDLIRWNIESMIIFTFVINIRTMMSMKKYASPSSSYDVPASSHDISNFNETVDVTQCSPVFIVLTEGKTPVMSAGIRRVTHSNFTHVSIGFDPSLSMMYSFGGPYEGTDYSSDSYGCRIENMADAVISDMYVKVFVCWISSDNVLKMKAECNNFINNQSNTSFNWGMIHNFVLGIDKDITEQNKYHQICSSFVNMLFKNAGITLFDDVNVPSPKQYEDLATSEENKNKFVQIYYGKAGAYSSKYFAIADKFATKRASRQFDEVVTECCLLKTNRFVFSNKIPYNCNFRDIVCCDMHPQFKDTKSALIYILTNIDSPIFMLINEYASTRELETLRNSPIQADEQFLKMIMRVCPYDPSFVDHHEFKKYTNDDIRNDYYKKYHNVGFHTDVNWLDKIAYGNNYLDGNYRKDAVGNNNTIGIGNTLDMIWKMFSPDACDNKSLANNICKVGSLMLDIIGLYSENRLPNWEFVRDVLCVLGEMLTRSMLHLYANNTQVIAISDTMEDSNDPGYMYSESFYVEAVVGKTPTSTPQAGQQGGNQQQGGNGKVQGATIQGQSNAKTNVNNALAKSKAYAAQFIKWVRKAFENIAEAFKNRHIAEINAVINNKETNMKIADELQNGSYKVPLNGVLNFDFKADNVSKLYSRLSEKLEQTPTNGAEYNAINVLKNLYKEAVPGITDNDFTDDNRRTQALVNWALYGKLPADTKPKDNQPLTSEMWNKIYVENLSKFVDNQKKVGDQFKADLENAGKKLETYTVQQGQNDKSKVMEEVLKNVAADSAAIQSALMNQFYKYNYDTYQTIIQNFKSRGDKTQTNQNNAQNVDQAQAEGNSDTVNPSVNNNNN